MNYITIPEELKALNQWVMWRWETRKGKRTKPPYQPNRKKASSTNSATQNDFQTVRDALEASSYFSGLGFVLTEGDSFVGIDLDECRNPETHEIASWAQEIIDKADSYAEISSSQTGVKLWIKGKLPGDSGTHNTVWSL